MPAYLQPKTGIIEKVEAPPAPEWELIPGAGTLVRTLAERRPGWRAMRIHHTKLLDHLDLGWEQVLWKKAPRPEAWTVGERSGVRFGFSPPTRDEKRAFDDEASEHEVIAVVLPDDPGMRSAAGCPGSRYYFQVGLVTAGIPADYLVEKLLSYRVRKLGMTMLAAEWIVGGERWRKPRGFHGPSPWQREKIEELKVLATHLSDDLAEAARQTFGSGQPHTAWSRQRQWEVNKAAHQPPPPPPPPAPELPPDMRAAVELLKAAAAASTGFEVVERDVQESAVPDSFVTLVELQLGGEYEPGEDVEWAAFGIIFALCALSFDDARPRGVSGNFFVEGDEFNVADLIAGLRFERGAIRYSGDYIRGRCVKTDITVQADGKVTIRTRARGSAALHWVDKLKGKKTLQVVEPEEDEQSE